MSLIGGDFKVYPITLFDTGTISDHLRHTINTSTREDVISIASNRISKRYMGPPYNMPKLISRKYKVPPWQSDKKLPE